MQEIQWIEIGDSYTAELEDGKVTIFPTVPGPYTARIETRTGKIVATRTLDLEGCKTWAFVNLPQIDDVSGALDDCGNVVETLVLCQRILSTDPASWSRIEYIKAWIAKQMGQSYSVVDISLPQILSHSLNWIEQGTEFVADTLHGHAVMQEQREIGGRIKYRASIVHQSGAELRCYWGTDFSQAEHDVKKQLEALDRPGISDEHINILDFTFDICRKILPPTADPIHYARLNMLQTRIHFAFD